MLHVSQGLSVGGASTCPGAIAGGINWARRTNTSLRLSPRDIPGKVRLQRALPAHVPVGAVHSMAYCWPQR